MNDIQAQRKYYERTSAQFDSLHLGNDGDAEHVLACQLIVAYLNARDPKASLLDIGGGTGRFYRYIRDNHPQSDFNLMAIEPSEAQRRIAYANGVPEDRHIEGDATDICFSDNTFDFCTEFGVLHHIKNNRKAAREMCRVASKGVFLSDCNKYGQGGFHLRLVKQMLRLTGTWDLMDFIRTGGRRYHFSEGDGVFYSFSAFDVLDILREKFPNVNVWPTRPASSPNLYMGTGHVLVVASV